MAPIRVLIADDHPPLRYGLRVLLEQDPGMQVIAEVSDGFSALQQIEYLQPNNTQRLIPSNDRRFGV